MATTYRHFTASGSWNVPSDVTEVDVLIVGGGGAGQGKQAGNIVGRGGGGAGGVLSLTGYTVTPSASVTVTVGAGGTSGATSTSATSGGDSSFDGQTAYGGGRGGSTTAGGEAENGGSGGGTANGGTPGTGTVGQGYGGGAGTGNTNSHRAGGGGGADGAGTNGGAGTGGAGGPGISLAATIWEPLFPYGLPTAIAGGGGGGAYRSTGTQPGGPGGFGGGGAGGTGDATFAMTDGQPAVAGTGSGGGGAAGNSSASGNAKSGGAGADGFVVLVFETADAPYITSISPDPAFIDDTVALVGGNFTGTTNVYLNDVAADNLSVDDDNNITFDIPAGINGLVTVSIESPTGLTLSVGQFSIVSPASVTQMPLLVVSLENQPVHVTQIPILAVSVPMQGAKVTQLPALGVWHPTPIPLPPPVAPEAPLREIWQFLTVVGIAENGKEQRARLRGYPRVVTTFNALVLNEAERRNVHDIMFKYIGKSFPYPMYQYSTSLAAEAQVGATKLYFNPTRTNLRLGEKLALVDVDHNVVHVANIERIDLDGAKIQEPLVSVAGTNLLVCPVVDFRITSGAGYRMQSVSGDMSVTMTSMDVRPTLRPNQSEALTTIDGLLLLDRRPLANDDVDENFDKNVTWLDNNISRPQGRTNWRVPYIDGTRQYFVRRSDDMDYWRAVANYMKGRQKPFLVPTFREDLPLAAVPALGATTIVSSNIQFFDFWRSKAYQYIRIQSDAGVIYRKIIEVTANYTSEGDPVSVNIRLTSSIGADAGANQNMFVSFVNTCRLENDSITLEHHDLDTIVELKIRTIEA